MKISDRDKKLILGVLLAAIIALPIFFFIKPKNESIAELDTKLVSLNERYNYLKELSEKQPFYESEIQRLTDERTSLIKGYATGILQENTIMFLRDIELNNPIHMAVLTFGGVSETPISDGYVNSDGEYVEGLTALSSNVTVAYDCGYVDVKNFLDVIFSNNEKMLISNITMSSAGDNNVQGTFTFNQFAIEGEGRTLDSCSVPKIDHGNNMIFPETIMEEEEEEAEAEAETAETN